MNKAKGLVAALVLAALVTAAVACGNGEASTTPDTSTAGEPSGGAAVSRPAPPPAVASVPVQTGRGAASVATASIGASYAASPIFQASSAQAGIWVTGEGTITLQPDLALLNIGVEATSKTVSQARAEEARAMDAIVAALHARGIADKDIQTQFFNISPLYEFREVLEEGIRTGKQVLVGYTVSNSASVKIRDLKAVGSIIDEVAAAGGDATRINGISFTVEDPKPLMANLREAAVKDAVAKAQQFATLTGVSLGKLVFISEAGGGVPVVKEFARGAMEMAAAPAPASPVSGGELQLQMTVQAVFDIQ